MTHLPCPSCLATITSTLYKLKPRLVLRVANIRYEKATVDSLFELDRAGIIVELHPISVTAELGMVYCKRHASQAEQEQWKLAKLIQRPQYDIDAAENVRLINIKLSLRKFVEQVRWFARMRISLLYSLVMIRITILCGSFTFSNKPSYIAKFAFYNLVRIVTCNTNTSTCILFLRNN